MSIPSNQNVSNLGNRFSSGINNVSSNISSNINTGLNALPSLDVKGKGAAFQAFMESNNLVARVAFLLLALLVFIIVLKMSIGILNYFFKTADSPYIINGMVNANTAQFVPQNPAAANGHPIQRSINGANGIEFTWSIWVYINNWPNSPDRYTHIFNKGINVVDETNNKGAMTINAPGLYISPTQGIYPNPQNNSLTVMMSTFTNINDTIIIPNVPTQKWVNIIIRCQNNTIDVYANGTIVASKTLDSVPKQNYGDIYLGNGKLEGYLSNLMYYNYALGTAAIQSITQIGPNTSFADAQAGSSVYSKFNKFFSLKWYFGGQGDQYNPR